MNHLLDYEVDLAHFDARFRNDTTGAPAYPPAMLLKVVLFAGRPERRGAAGRGLASQRGWTEADHSERPAHAERPRHCQGLVVVLKGRTGPAHQP